MNNKCSLKFGSDVFRLLSRAEAFPWPSLANVYEKILGGERERRDRVCFYWGNMLNGGGCVVGVMN